MIHARAARACRGSFLAGLLALGAPQEHAELTPALEVLRVVDGDTIHVLRDGATEKLRLLSVDTEEKITGSLNSSPTKPATVFGEETALWARDLFAGLAGEGRRARVRLRFPGGEERYDVYGRLLCHVILPDGRDYNLMLVELGKSPYFNKYGNSLIAHEELMAAQARARSLELGIWSPATNRPAAPEAPMALRPYDALLPWWEARAEAIDEFRRRASDETDSVLSAEDAAGLRAAVGRMVEVFGSIERFYEEEDGSLTALFRSAERELAFRAVLPRRSRGGALEKRLRRSTEELRQNYLFVAGLVEEGTRGPRIRAGAAHAWRRAGPEPE